ncbi:phospholipase [Massilia sp. W12]|uniref:phospholipase n=1 Tax=Massilia sp. W12 TaxID=3126507 RepID=UPI0030CDF486
MASITRSGLALVLTAVACLPAQAFQQETHRRIAIDAVRFMQNNPGITNYNKLASGLAKAGITVEQFAQAMGQGAYDVDDFADTYLCGAVTGSCVQAPLWGLAKSLVNYTSYWHFQNHTAGADVHGNPFGGYNYSKLTVAGDIDNLAAVWLVGDYLDDGPGGMRGWFGDWSKYNSFGVTEAHYRHAGFSTSSQYADFEKAPFQPLDNLGQYWFGQFLARPSLQSLGFVMHTTDLLQPHHTWTTSARHHVGWEQWVNDYYHSLKLNDEALVKSALADFTPLPAGANDIRPLLTQGGTYSYQVGASVLSSTDHNDRSRVAKQVVPHAIAMVVHILNRAAERLNQ